MDIKQVIFNTENKKSMFLKCRNTWEITKFNQLNAIKKISDDKFPINVLIINKNENKNIKFYTKQDAINYIMR